MGKALEDRDKYYVKKNVAVDLTDKAPKALPQKDYEFAGWNSPLKGSFTADKVITAQYRAKEMVIPGNEEKPESYITVTFDKGTSEKLEGQDKFYVLKDKMIDLTAKAPTAIPKAGYKCCPARRKKEREKGLKETTDRKSVV